MESMQKRWRTVSWIALAIGTLFVGWEIRVVRITSMRRIYSELKYGDTRQIVLQKMGQPDSIGFGGDILYWDGVPQKESKDKKKYEFKYVIWKLGLDGSFDLGFDENDRLISKTEFR